MGISVSRSGLIAAASLSVLLAACGGGGGSGTSADTGSGSAQAPTGGSSTQTPTGSGTASGGSAPVANAKPTITGTPTTAVAANSTYTFQPTASDPDGDVLTFSIQNPPPWASFDAATGKLTGTPGAGNVGAYDNIAISVTDGAADASLSAFSINVEAMGNKSVELSWQAPTQNEDGSPLTDLAGFKVYWGTSPGNYPNTVTVDNPSVLTYVLSNLVPNTYYFVATAVNSQGEESAPSPMATATIS